MVVMDKQDYINEAEELLAQPAYRTIPKDPTNKIRAQLITKLRTIRRENSLDEGTYKAMHPASCMDYQKFIKLATLSGLLFQVGAQLPVGWPRSLAKFSNP